MGQDFKTELPISSWLASTGEKFVFLFVLFLILSSLFYVAFGSFSGIYVQISNAAFSVGNDNLGKASYTLALEFNRNLKEAMGQCTNENTLKHYEMAINQCSKAIEINENFAAAYSWRGVAYMNLMRYDEAIPDFTKDIEIIPVATRSYINRGIVYMKQKKYDWAISDFTKSIEINPKEKQAYLNRCLAYLEQGQNDLLDLALSDGNKAVELDEKYSDAYSCSGVALARQGKYDLAIIKFDKAIELAPRMQALY